MEKIPLSRVPQADELNRVISTVEAVYNGYDSDFGIADYIGFTDRQGRYYRLAGEILGLLENHNNKAVLTTLGKDLIVLDDNNRLKKIRTILKENILFNNILSFIEQNEDGVSRNEMLNYLPMIMEGADTTLARRLYTIINWLTYSSLIKIDFRELDNEEKETIYKINDHLDASDYSNSSDSSASIYPANYPNEELDIKELHMQVISFIRKKEQGKIVVPEFQRNKVWKQQQKSRFIESLVLNIPIPPFYISQDLEGNMIIVDGLQRSTALFEFLSSTYSLVGLEALPQLNGKNYSALETELKARIEDRELLLYILKPSVPMSIVYDIFNRINSNGTPLTRQEIRNCIYIGSSTRLLKQLSETVEFKKATENGIPSLRMKNMEAVLRFLAFALHDYDVDYKGDLDDFLGKTMRTINRLTDSALKSLEYRFTRAMNLTYMFFGSRNFRLPTENSRGRINLALMEAISIFFDKQSDEFLTHNKNIIIKNYYEILLHDSDFLDSVRVSTGTIKNVKTRFDKIFQILKSV